MYKYIIRGGNELVGRVRVSGAKNAVLKLMAASVLTKGKTVVRNVPKITDVFIMADVLERLGASVDLSQEAAVVIDTSKELNSEAPYELVKQMRASIMVLGPLLASLGRAKVAMPGGCNIGSRKIDMHVQGLRKLGARFRVGHGYIQAQTDGLKGALLTLDFPSVGATENLLMAAVLAEGTTLIENAAREPEVVDLANFLQRMGAKIEGAGTSTLEIEGVASLSPVEYTVIPDRVEAGTFLMAGAITRGEVTVEGARAEHLELVLSKMEEMGVEIEQDDDCIRVSLQQKPRAADIATLPYPGFPTDLQAQVVCLLSLAKGTSVVTENVFENRFSYIDELNRMGSDIRTDGHHAIVKGVRELTGAPVRVGDLRGGAALILAGLAAKGVTEVSDVFHVDRGYEKFEDKLVSLGADIIRVEESSRQKEMDYV